MQKITFHPDTPLGGIVYHDAQREIVHLKLQPQNHLPAHQNERAMLLIALAGAAEIHTADATEIVDGQNMVLLAPNEWHRLSVLAPDTQLLVIKH